MELINKNYIRIEIIDLYTIISTSEDDMLVNNSNKLLNLIYKWEKDKGKDNVDSVFVNINSKFATILLEKYDLYIKREVIVNACMSAMLNDDIDILKELREYVSNKRTRVSEMDSVTLKYILENSMKINEYFDGEERRVIYDESNNRLKGNYIFRRKNENNRIK